MSVLAPATWPDRHVSAVRLMHVDPERAALADRSIGDLPGLMRAGDLVVLNESSCAVTIMVDGREAFQVRPGTDRVLDDIGAEKTSEWVEETLNLIVNTRYSERRLTIFTSNYEIKEDLTDPDSLTVRVGFRMWSRLHEMCDFLRLDGVDYRELGPDASLEELVRLEKRGRPTIRKSLPSRAGGPLRAQLREKDKDDRHDLRWTGGKAGS